MGYDLKTSEGPIIPIVVGNTGEAVRLSNFLHQNGILIPAIRPPTVPRGTDRLRVTVTAKHEPAHIERLLNILQRH